jgi:uncharacterized protein YijF (DUF1287 family)
MKKRINRKLRRRNLTVLAMIIWILAFGSFYFIRMVPRWIQQSKMKNHRMIVLSQHFINNVPDYLRHPWHRYDFDQGDVLIYNNGQFGILLDGHQSRLPEILNLEFSDMDKGLYPSFRYVLIEGTKWHDLLDLLPARSYKSEHFGIKEVLGTFDYNKDGFTDAQNFVSGGREGAYSLRTYVDKYYWNSYPPAGEGVCTDVIWMAYREAGYTLRRMVHKDIVENTQLYWRTGGAPDMAIDFRRVNNLYIYLRRKAIQLTSDLSQVEQWQPGDIVVFWGNHIGIVSDKRDRYGVPYMIHHGGGLNREESAMHRQPILGHFRFDASKLSPEDLIPWQ